MDWVESGEWAAAEGVLLRLSSQGELNPLPLADALAYVQLQQGQYAQCLATLQPVLEHPERTFWLVHKAGDASRGLGELAVAIAFYRQALAEGSDSFLTYRNLLQVLSLESNAAALEALADWFKDHRGDEAAPWLKGAREAAATSLDLELAAWLDQRGLADAPLQRRLLQERLYGLDPSVLNAFEAAAPDCVGADVWQQALAQRLRRLQFAP